MKPIWGTVMIVSLMLLLSPCMAIDQSPRTAVFEEAVAAGELADPRITEASGMAPSRLDDNLLWILNDGGSGAMLFAADTTGRALARFTVKGAKNKDWEDLASFVKNGRSYLLIADVGDNDARRKHCTLYFVEEPVVETNRDSGKNAATVAWRTKFVYEDGPRDCESVAVDIANGRVLLLSKRESVPSLYSLPLGRPGDDSKKTATRVGKVPQIPPPTAKDLLDDPIHGAYGSRNTAMDIAPDGGSALVLTYKCAYWYPRAEDETWEGALSKKPSRILFPKLWQAEAACFSQDGKSVFVTSENRPAPLYRIPMKTTVFKTTASKKQTDTEKTK